MCATAFFVRLLTLSFTDISLGIVCLSDEEYYNTASLFYDVRVIDLAWGFILPYVAIILCVNYGNLKWDIPATNALLFPAVVLCFKMRANVE